MKGYLYILQSQKNARYYIGSTNNCERRLQEHNQGRTTYTRSTRLWKLLYKKEFSTLIEARRAEHKLKKLKSRIIIEKLLKDD